MAKVLILANFELSFELGDGKTPAESSVRATERRILRFLKKLADEEPQVKGTVETLEFEGFTYESQDKAEPQGYYYNKYEHDTEAKPGPA